MQVGIPVVNPNKDHSPTAKLYNKPPNHEQRTIKSTNNASSSIRQNYEHAPNKNALQRPNQFNKSSSLGNLSFINIVGLPQPCHPRQTSVPSGTTLRNQVGYDGTTNFPNHFRNVSETAAVPPRPPRANSLFNGNNNEQGSTNLMLTQQQQQQPPAIPPKINRTSMETINNNNWTNYNNYNNNIVNPQNTCEPTIIIGGTVSNNSSIKPSSLIENSWSQNGVTFSGNTSAISNSYSNNNNNCSTSSGTTFARPQSDITHVQTSSSNESIWNNNQSSTNENVSNINVNNFYRAVPMNVISSVPTIKCLNTTHINNSAKNVSNVQIMPLSGNGCCNTNVDHQNSGSTSFVCKTSSNSTQVTVHNNEETTTPTQLIGPSTNNETVSSVVYLSNKAAVPPPQQQQQRTFTSTEAQTDDTTLCCPELSSEKERRRRERRERRQNRRTNPVRSMGESSTQTTNGTTNNSVNPSSSSLPDILDNHIIVPPPYSTHPNTMQRNHQPPLPQVVPRGLPHIPVSVAPNQILTGIVPPPGMVPPHARTRNAVMQNNGHVPYPPPNVIPGQVPLVQNVPDGNSGFRFALPVGQFRRDHFSEEAPKGCCGVLSWKPGSLKWFIASIALVAVGCVLVGTALGTMRPAGRDHITIALLMIGIGIVLVTISGIAWRLASQNTTSCRTMLGIGSLESVDVCTRRFVPRLPPSYGRPHHPYAAMMYPEFQYRPPPPTYQASMQEYRLRLLLIDRGNTPQIQAASGGQGMVSPPPTYRSHTGSLIRDPLSIRNESTWSEYSCPPSYRSQTYSSRLGTIRDAIPGHNRDPSLSISEQTNENAVDVVNILRSTSGGDEDIVTLQNIDLDTKNQQDDSTSPYKLILGDCGGSLESGSKEENLVTIVQTDERNPVIVTVSGSTSSERNDCNNGDDKMPSEIQILAHL